MSAVCVGLAGVRWEEPQIFQDWVLARFRSKTAHPLAGRMGTAASEGVIFAVGFSVLNYLLMLWARVAEEFRDKYSLGCVQLFVSTLSTA